jgi:hypothetical protein
LSRLVVAVLLAVVHVLVGAAWLGAMGYSLGVVQPRARRFFARAPREYEDLATTLAAGARWKVVGVLAVLAASGAGLVGLAEPHQTRSGWWWLLIAAKAGLLCAASAVFWHVSWRMWPRRLFALPGEQAAHQRAFLRAGWAMTLMAGAATVLGVTAARLGR